MQNKIILIISFVLLSLNMALGQTLVIEKFEEIPGDLEARLNKSRIYATEEIRPTSIEELEQGNPSKRNKYCALVKVELVIPDAQFEGATFGPISYANSEYKVYLKTDEAYSLRVIAPGYLPIDIQFRDYLLSGLKERTVYRLILSIQKPNRHRPSCSYIETNLRLGKASCASLNIGGYYKNFNFEGTFSVGLKESKEIAWKAADDATSYGYSYTYNAMYYDIKTGYGFIINNYCRLTPQIGIGLAHLSGSRVREGIGSSPDVTQCQATPISFSLRFEYAISPHLGISLNPELRTPIYRSDTYAKLSELSPLISGFAQGVDARIGLYVCF